MIFVFWALLFNFFRPGFSKWTSVNEFLFVETQHFLVFLNLFRPGFSKRTSVNDFLWKNLDNTVFFNILRHFVRNYEGREHPFFADQEVKKIWKHDFFEKHLKNMWKKYWFSSFFHDFTGFRGIYWCGNCFYKNLVLWFTKEYSTFVHVFCKKITFLEKTCFFLLLLAFTKEGSVSKLSKSMIFGHFSQKSWLIWLAQLIVLSGLLRGQPIRGAWNFPYVREHMVVKIPKFSKNINSFCRFAIFIL